MARIKRKIVRKDGKPVAKSTSIYKKDNERIEATANDRADKDFVINYNNRSKDKNATKFIAIRKGTAGKQAVKNAKEDRADSQKYYRNKYTFTKGIKKPKKVLRKKTRVNAR